MFVRSRALPAVLAMAVLISACGADSSTGPDANQPATLDQALTAFSNPAIAAANSAFFDAGAAAPGLGLGRCPYAAASQSFVCTPFSADGVAINQSFTLLSAAGVPQSAFDAATTDAIKARTTMAGTLNANGTSLDVDGQQDMTLSGLISGPRTLNGGSTTRLEGIIADIFGSSTLDATLTTTITSLVIPNKSADGTQPWPSSGTIVVESTGTVGGAAIPSIRISMQFSGTSTVNVARTTNGATQNCTMDLTKVDQGCK
jgi:hypothetical protein